MSEDNEYVLDGEHTSDNHETETERDREDEQANDREADEARGEKDERIHDEDRSNNAPRGADSPSAPRLGPRVLVTWIELTLVGLTGTLLGATVGGPPGFIIYLFTTLVTVGVLFYNVNELIKRWMWTTNHEA